MKIRRTRNLESTNLLWLTNKPNEAQFNQLRDLIDYVQIFDETSSCKNYIEQIPDNQQIYVITSIPLESNRAHIYLYKDHEQNFNDAIQLIEADYSNAGVNQLGMNIFQQSTHSQLNSEFLWFQQILAILLDKQNREKARSNLIDAYKKYFDGNRRKEEKIKVFENTYRSENALEWYSRECFFYEILNKALRTQDIDVLFSLRFFLQDIYEQLKIEYNKANRSNNLLVYRGQIISSLELKQIQANIGQLISLNSFISTTINEQVAKSFSASGNQSEGEQVLFHIKVSQTITNSKPFADIAHRSSYVNEEEILFMAGSIFEIKSASFSDSGPMWIIELELCNDDAYELHAAYQADRDIVHDENSPFSLSAVLLRMGLFDKAKIYYQQLLEEGSVNECSSIDLIVNCYWGLGNVNRKQEEFDISLAYYCLAIELCPNRLDLLSRSYKYISLAYLDAHDISQALEYQTKALEIERSVNDSLDQIAESLYNLGVIYFAQSLTGFDQALNYFLQALSIYKNLKMNDNVIQCYDSIGQVYLRQRKKTVALKCHLRALKLICKYYPSRLACRIYTYECIGKIYESTGNYHLADKYYQDALSAKLKYEPLNDPSIASSYELIGGIHHKKGEYAKAIEIYDRSIAIRRSQQSDCHPSLLTIIALRNNLQKLIEDYPGVVFDLASWSEDESAADPEQPLSICVDEETDSGEESNET